MFCIKCGSKIADDSTFCGDCGAQVDNCDNQINKQIYHNQRPNNNIFNKLKRFLPVILAVVVIGTVIFNIVINTGKFYLYKTLLQTKNSYTKEFNAMKNSNNVLKNAEAILEKSYTQTLTVPGAKIEINNSKKDKIISAQLNYDEFPIALKGFITDKYIIAGSPDFMYVKANAKDLSRDLAEFASANSLSSYDDISSIFKDKDLSYSSINNMINKLSKEQKALYVDLFKSFLAETKYKKGKSKIEIDDKEQNCNYLTLSIDNEKLSDWINDKLIPRLEKEIPDNDSELLKYASNQTFSQSIDIIDNLKALAEYYDELEDGTIFRCGFYVIKDVIVGVDVSMLEDHSENYVISILATGKKYRLNDIKVKYESDSNETSLTLSGDHIGDSVISSTIKHSYSYSGTKAIEDTVKFKWDTKKSKDNFTVKSKNDVIFTATIATNDDSVNISYDDPYSVTFDYTLEPLNEKIQLPKESTSLRELSEKDFTDKLLELEDDGIYLY